VPPKIARHAAVARPVPTATGRVAVISGIDRCAAWAAGMAADGLLTQPGRARGARPPGTTALTRRASARHITSY
jgi:hypothetical protein